MTVLQVTKAHNGRVTAAAQVLKRVLAAGTSSPPSSPFSARLPEGNLAAQAKFNGASKGSPSELNSGAMFFYTNQVKLRAPTGKMGFQKRTGMYVFGALATSLGYPELQLAPTPNKDMRRQFRKVLIEIGKAWTTLGTSALVSVTKKQDHFLVKVPVYVAGDSTIKQLRPFYTNQDMSTDPSAPPGTRLDDVPVISEGFIPSRSLKKNGGPFDPFLPKLQAVEHSGIEIRRLSGTWVFLMVLSFTEREASVMTQTPWLEIRPIDFYGLMRAWADGRIGAAKADPPIYAHPLHRIASTLPKGGKSRVSTDLGIMIDESSDYWAIPPEVNAIGSFDSTLANHLRRADGSYCAVPTDPADRPADPPKSGLVFLDWVNLKMAYVDGSGHLAIKGLDRVVPANVTHYVRVMQLPISKGKQMESVISQVMNLASAMSSSITQVSAKDLVRELLKEEELQGLEPEDLNLEYVYKYKDVVPECKWFVDACEKLKEYADTSIENLYSRYAFVTVSQILAYVRIFLHCGPKLDELKAQDRERRKAYIEQSMDANYQLENDPFIQEADANGKNGRALMPHQVRTANKMRHSPNFAILAVDAGGGKTASCIHDFLKELGKGNVRRGLIMCPAHLVGQYVKEFLYFTKGRVNVIAVNSYTLRRHKLQGLAALLEKAPPNSVVVTDYNLAQGKTKSPAVGYGVAATRVYPVVEMLRSFQFDYVFCDESHFLKNATGRSAAVSRLISDIPYKRLASGTLTPNEITDLIQQVALLDPTIFPADEFRQKYAETWSSTGKVLRWKEGYEKMLLADLMEHVVWCQAKRKEWAALLPPLKEEPTFAPMTDAQQRVYNTILNEIVEEIKKAAGTNKRLREALLGAIDQEAATDPTAEDDADAEGDSGEEGDDEEDPVDMDQLLKPYLARLERFTVAPAADMLGNLELTGEDRVSPKIAAIVKLIEKHFASGVQGKILIFCNYIESANAIYENLPPDLQAQTIHYKAADKEQCGAQFERDDGKQIMVGVEQSMNTGLNLQFCSRLIRVDSVWTPGALEQGNSRIQRPNVKVVENRGTVFIDWVIAPKSIDMTKYCFLLQKQVTIGKWEEAKNPRFQQIKVPPRFPMSLDMIRNSNQLDQGDLVPYYEAYREFKYATFAEYREYKEKNKGDLDPATNSVRMTPIQKAENLPGSALMYRIPYVPGTELYKAEDLGLIRYDAYMRINEDELEGDDEDDGEATGQKLINRQELSKVDGMCVHTEYGDGTIVGVGKKALKVELPSGERVTVNKLAAFMITRAQTNNKDQRELLLRQIGDVPFDKPFELEVKDAKAVRIPKNQLPEQKTIAVALSIMIQNDMVSLQFEGAKQNPEGARVLEAIGFNQPPPYYYALMTSPDHMKNQMIVWQKAGFTVHKDYSAACKDLYLNLKQKGKNTVNLIGRATEVDLKNFFKLQIKPIPDRFTICPYPIIENSKVYLALPITGHPGSANAISKKAPGVAWFKADVEDTRVVTMRGLRDLDRNMQKLLQDGIVVTNLKELLARRNRLLERQPGLLKGL